MSGRAFALVAGGVLSVLFTIAATGGAQNVDPGERLMNAGCQDCHSLRTIQVAAMDLDGWTKVIAREIERGAKVSTDDAPTLAAYLARTHGPVPVGPAAGREVFLNVCTQCHDLFRIRLGRRSAEEWEETLVSMLNEGAQLSDEQFHDVHQYLSRNFGVE